MLQAKLLYCLSKNKHICILSFLSAQAQWEVTDRGCQTLPKYVVKLHRSQKRFHLSLTARETLRSGPSLGALMENSLKFQSTLKKMHFNEFLSLDIPKSDSKTQQL